MKALIEIDVPEWQIGKTVDIYFPDTMHKRGIVMDCNRQNIVSNEEILKTTWPDIDIVKFEDEPDIEFANCWFSDSKYLMQVDKKWLKEEYKFSKEY